MLPNLARKSSTLSYRRNCFSAVIFALVFCGIFVEAQVPPQPTSVPGSLADADDYIRADRLGITFISSIDSINHPSRYRNALILGAGWNRWPMYWNRVEREPDRWDWSDYDRLVAADLDHGLQINAILLGNPAFWQEGESIANLFQPIFADGTDSAAVDVPINPNNPWARFVYRAVSRYRPAGTLAEERGFPDGTGVRVWEIWNEPDLPLFWQGGKDAYARMLKTAAIVIKTVDPQATVMFGGLLLANDEYFFSQVLRIFSKDSLRDEFNWFFDAVAVHSYDDPWRSGWLTKFLTDTLAEYELVRPIWLNETGISVWNDYPGPIWASSADQRLRLATTEQQASFLIMSAAFAWSKGADKVLYHQLFDDCGNQPPGTDFAPHSGELCADGICYGDAFGIYRNPRDAICFSQHPLANTPRPVAYAFRTLARVFGGHPFAASSVVGLNDTVTSITFTRETDERILVIWNNTYEALTHSVKAKGSMAVAHYLDGQIRNLPAAEGKYLLHLQPASDYNFPDLENSRASAIGGEPIILVEKMT